MAGDFAAELTRTAMGQEARYQLRTTMLQQHAIGRAGAVYAFARAGRYADAARMVQTKRDPDSVADPDVGHALLRTLQERCVSAIDALMRADAEQGKPWKPLPEYRARVGPDGAVIFELTEHEAGTLVSALDMLGRLHLGQHWTLVEAVAWWRVFPRDQDTPNVRQVLEGAAQYLTGLPLHASWAMGYRELDAEAQVAYDIQQVIRHRLAWDRTPEGGITVDFDPPRKWSREPLPAIQRLNGPTLVARSPE